MLKSRGKREREREKTDREKGEDKKHLRNGFRILLRGVVIIIRVKVKNKKPNSKPQKAPGS